MAKKGKEGVRAKKNRMKRLLAGLHELYPDATTALDHENALELLVATILSAQCTDARVNLVTPALFERFPSAQDYADAELEEIEGYIHSTGFYRNKAKSLKGLGEALVRDHVGEVPGEMKKLVKLPGVGRKTANVILGNWFGVPAIAVDTHVKRLSGRLGLSERTTPDDIEQDLMKLAPKEEWTFTSHGLILHGRQVCKARKPACEGCALRKDCPYPG